MTALRGVGLFLLAPFLLAPGAAFAAGFVEVPATFAGATVVLGEISGDGHVLVGRTVSPGPFAGIRWTQAGGWQDLGPPPGNAYGRPSAASFDGTRVAASGNVASGLRFVLGSGWQALFGGEALAISANGNTVAGSLQQIIIFPDTFSYLQVWRQGIGTTSQHVASSPWSYSTSAITGDGTAVYGNRQSILGHSIPMRFVTSGGGGVDLPVVPAGTSDDCVEAIDDFCGARALAVSDDGNTLVGDLFLSFGDPAHAVRWKHGGNEAPELLDGGPPGPYSSAADASGNGQMIVGERDGHAFLWTADGGMQDLQDLLEGLGVDLTGWTLTNALAISDDGSAIAGTGTRPGGAYAIWLAQAPELVPVDQVPALGAWGGLALSFAIALAALRARRISR